MASALAGDVLHLAQHDVDSLHGAFFTTIATSPRSDAAQYGNYTMVYKPRPEDLLPLSPPVYHILLALGSESMHGYAIMQAFSEKMRGREALLPGTLYATIARMVGAELIEELPAPSTASSDKRRRYYRVTAFGRAVAEAESARLQRLLDLARRERFVGDGVSAKVAATPS